MAVLKNRAKMSTSTTGTGTITLGSAESGFQTFADAGVANGDVVRYVIEDGSNFEIGTGTYTASGTTLTRTVSESSNSDAAINLSGSATVFIGATAEDILSDVVDDTTPQLGGNLDVQAREITTSTTNGNVKLTPNGTGVVEVKGAGGNDGTLQLNCSVNSHGVKIKSPPHSAGASYTLTLPDNDGAASEFLQTDGSGNLSWAAGGGGADLYAANEVSVTAQPSATGDDAIAIGDSAVASGANAVASGANSIASGTSSFAAGGGTASGFGSLAIGGISGGGKAVASSDTAIALGYQAQASNYQTVAIGRLSSSSGDSSLALGRNASATGSYSTSIGQAYSSGADSFAAAIATNSSSYGATGANSIAIGKNAKATAQESVCISNTSTASGSNAAVLGGSSGTASGSGSVALGGSSNVADGIYSTAKGYYGNANGIRLKHATGVYPNQQGAYYVLGYTTSDATPIALNTSVWTPSSTNQIVLPNNSAFFFSGTCIAREQAADGTDVGAWEFKGAIRREANAGTTTLIKSTIDEFNVPTGWALALSADTTNGCLKIQATGVAATDIRWVATVQTSEVIYA